jgi:hypothetical protein
MNEQMFKKYEKGMELFYFMRGKSGYFFTLFKNNLYKILINYSINIQPI